MQIFLPNTVTPATAKDVWKQYQARDNQPGDEDPRADVLHWSEGAQKVEVQLNHQGFLARQTEAAQISVTRLSLPRWMSESQVETICRTVQGAYSGFLGGVPITAAADSQDVARKAFYEWQKPLQKPGGG